MNFKLDNISPMELRRLILEELKKPTIFRGYIDCWPAMRWSLKDWAAEIGQKVLTFRVGSRVFSQIPQWEGECATKELSINEFTSFLKKDVSKNEWCYFDYKHMAEWFHDNPSILQSVNWGVLGFAELRGEDSTLWIGSEGAHTPCHIDTYGCNLVAQTLGRKQWILFPPESKQMKPTRVPYEESSIFSDLNFYSPPHDLCLKGAHVVELNPGDVLFVPAGWWHYVETLSPVAVSINTWIPLPSDKFRQIEEALVKVWVASVSQLSASMSTSLLNPNEYNMPEDPNILDYVWRAVGQCVDLKEPSRKRARLCTEVSEAGTSQQDLKNKCSGTVVNNEYSVSESFTDAVIVQEVKSDNLSDAVTSQQDMSMAPTTSMTTVSEISEQEFLSLMRHKRLNFDNLDKSSHVEGNNFSKCKKLINAVCDKDVLNLISKKLLQSD